MKWSHRLVSASLVVLLSLQITLAGARAANKSNDEQVQSALQAEASGALKAREEELQKALDLDPTSKAANWQSGKLERDGRWINFKDLHDQSIDEATLAQYREKRSKAAMTAPAQLELANWCRSHRLFDRERAHLIAALELSNDGNDRAIRTRLGLRLVDGAWLSEEEIKTAKLEQAAHRKNLKTWQPNVQRLSNRLDSPKDEVRAQARLELEALDDPEVIPALEAVLAEANLGKARLLVELLGRFKVIKAAEPLARLAVFSEWQVVRKEAAAKLRERPIGSYVPELLASMRTPIDSKINLFVGADGVRVSQLLTSETQNANQTLERVYSNNIQRVNTVTGGRSIPVPGAGQRRRERAAEAISIRGEQVLNDAELQVAQVNNEIEAWNGRICTVLADATGLKLEAKPESWWDWWRDYNQLSQQSKRTEYQTTYQYETTYIAEAVPQVECLVAGTPVWTDHGVATIESIQVGDLVLSKQPETGELSYKPVLRTTVRNPEPVMKVTTDHGQIRGTGGHVFWISGKGWTRLRDVKRQERFHGVTSPATIQKIDNDGKEKTYNLVVADFHTYFAGPDLVLSHDVTYAKPLDAPVPGMKVAANR